MKHHIGLRKFCTTPATHTALQLSSLR